MFQLYPGALDSELQRRHEVLQATMRAVRGTAPAIQRVAEVTRFRHVLVALAALRG
jgi:hypothetical protein